MSGGLRAIAAPFVVAPPSGVRVRTRLMASPEDAAVLGALGRYLASLAGTIWRGAAVRVAFKPSAVRPLVGSANRR